jgi:hypothetical protein
MDKERILALCSDYRLSEQIEEIMHGKKSQTS